jgi:acyl-CoA synthetase (NDP forming)
LAQAYTYAKWKTTPLGILPDHSDIDLAAAKTVIQKVRARGGGWLLPDELEQVFSAFGITALKGKFVTTPDEAVQAAKSFGFPVVVKMISLSLVHKSEWGGVKVGLEDAEAVRLACSDIEQQLGKANKLSELAGFLVQPMFRGGVELMVGMTEDPLFGPLIAFGLGGIHVEILRDVVFRITPLTDRDAKEMVSGVRGYKLLQGYRGTPQADIAAAEALLLRISRLVEEIPDIAELDLNPIRALEPGQGCVVLDARMRV